MVNLAKYLLRLVILVSLMWPALSLAQEKNVLIAMSKNSRIYQNVVEQIKEQLTHSGFRKVDLDILTISSDDDLPETSVLNLYDILVTVGTKAAQSILSVHPKNKVLSVLIPKSTYESILKQNNLLQSNSKYSAIYIDQPFKRQLEFSRRLLPKAKSIGAILGPYSKTHLKDLTKEVNKKSLNLEVVTVTEDQSSTRQTKALLGKSDALLAIPDPIAFSPQRAKWLLYLSYQQRVSVIAFSRSYVNAGALAAVYSTPEQIGKQAGERIVSVLQNEDKVLRSIFPKYFSIAINDSVARSLRISVPSLDRLSEELQSLEVDG